MGDSGGGRVAILARLEDQIRWYDRRSRTNQRGYQVAKVVEIILAAAVPLLAGLSGKPVAVGIVGMALVVLQGVEHLFVP